ncbi:MAG: hypothetical protein FWH36_01245 [Lentimicrobiaceae bacterium]|nr:hypothetical protein [Lentimicrobiaceae bacterium]
MTAIKTKDSVFRRGIAGQVRNGAKAKRNIFYIIFFALMAFEGRSQTELPKQKVDSSGVILFLTPNFTYHFVMADLRKEFGNNLSIGTDLCLTTKSNWTADFGFKYYFNGQVTDEVMKSTFENITADGLYIPQNGLATGEVSVDFRAVSFHLQGGKVFPVSQKFRNSGVWIKVGLGVMQHYLQIKNPQQPEYRIPALEPEYAKGYDRLTLGFSLNQFVGYMHLTKKSLLCFYGGVEFYEIFAHRQREYDFNLMRKDDAKPFEGLIGLKIGWIIPLYKHNPYAEYEYR